MNDRLADRFDPALSLGKAAFRSWASMKTPVMSWLWGLNVLYLIAIVFLPAPEAKWTLIAYVAVGPVLATMVVRQRGLTRLSGFIHLPWVPFVLYVGLRLFTDAFGPSLSTASGAFYLWLQLVFWATVVCLAFDVYDVIRWFRGERFVLGTPAAAAAGASKLASQSLG